MLLLKAMIRSFAALAFVLAAAGCTTTDTYRAADGGGFGYSDQAIESNRYRVSYRSNDASVSEDGALRRAAEITVRQGYDYFTVVARDLERERGGAQSSVGVGGGSFGRRSSIGLGVNVPLGSPSERVTSRLEIVMATGERPDDPRAYDAQSILRNLSGL